MKLRDLYYDFTSSEKASGIILLFCTVLSLMLANSSIAQSYLHLWHVEFLHKPLEFWINDGLMTIFFLLVGLEIEREIYIGELADLKKSLLPVMAAIGGMLVPAIIHYLLNHSTTTQNGFGIPMATDIAFSLAILSLLGKRVPLPLKIFLTALAIIDDLGAIIVIALFYSKGFSFLYFSLAIALLLFMFILNRLKIYYIGLYLIPGMIMWYFMYRSGIHATITGVLLAFVIPFGKGDETSVSYKLQHYLHVPVAFIILPLFALANTAIFIPSSVINDLASHNSYGIILGLFIGKPIGIFCFSLLGISLGWCNLPGELKKQHILWTGLLAGIGFTMSIFITLLAFADITTITTSKIAIIIGSLLSAIGGYVGLRLSLKKKNKGKISYSYIRKGESEKINSKKKSFLWSFVNKGFIIFLLGYLVTSLTSAFNFTSEKAELKTRNESTAQKIKLEFSNRLKTFNCIVDTCNLDNIADLKGAIYGHKNEISYYNIFDEYKTYNLILLMTEANSISQNSYTIEQIESIRYVFKIMERLEKTSFYITTYEKYGDGGSGSITSLHYKLSAQLAKAYLKLIKEKF